MSGKKKQNLNTDRKKLKRERKSKQKVHASTLHSRTQSPKPARKSEIQETVADIRHKFSFPSALSQVREVVQRQPKKPVKTVLPKPQPPKTENFSPSPYVLDLKSRRTVLPGEIVKRSEPKKKKENKETIMSLFEPLPPPPSELLKQVTSFGQQFKKRQSTNFAPIPHEFKPGESLSRTFFRLKARIRNFFIASKPESAFKFEVTPDKHRSRKVSVTQGSPLSAGAFAGLLGARKAKEAAKVEKTARFLAKKEKRNPLSSFVWKGAFSFATMCLLLILPIAFFSFYGYLKQSEQKVLGATNLALNQLQEAKLQAGEQNFFKATESFQQAGQAFQAAGALIQNQFGPAADVISVIPAVGARVKTAKALLSSGADLSRAAGLFSQGAEVFTDEDHFLADQPLSYKLEYLLVRIELAQPLLKTASKSLEKVDLQYVPEESRAQVGALQSSLPQLADYVGKVNDMSPALLSFVGHDRLQRYLVIFQNNTELRATGGFMGSLALMDLDRGEIKNIEIPGGGPYDFQGSLFDNYVAPRALQLINPRWELQDANWFLDFPTSAAKIEKLYEKAGGPSVDGVIAIDTQVLESLLAFVGGVEYAKTGEVLTADNFKEIIQHEVEFEYDKELNQPKQVIADLAPILLDEIKNLPTADYLDFADRIGQLLQQRDILLYHSNENVSSRFTELGWSGEVVETKGDYLAVVHTNLAGGKTDAVIDDRFDLTVHVDEKGQNTNTLTVTRTHNGVKGEPLTGVRNVDYLRVYVPLGSRIISASGFEQPPAELFENPDEEWLIDEDLAPSLIEYHQDEATGTEVYVESGKTVFANWIQVDPGQSKAVQISYQPPKTLRDYQLPARDNSWLDWFSGNTVDMDKKIRFYNLYWQKQPGSWEPEMSVTVNFPQQWSVKSDSYLQTNLAAGKWMGNAVMAGDSLWQLLFY